MKTARSLSLLCLIASACARPFAPVQAAPHLDAAVRMDSTSGVKVRLDSAHQQVVVTVSGIHMAGGVLYGQSHGQTNIAFVWPFAGWARGYSIDVFDSAGHVLPRKTLHHAGLVNLDRRQIAYPMAERLIAAAHETPSVMLPSSMGVPLAPDQHMVLYYMLVNPTAQAINGATLRISIAWTPAGAGGPRDVFPLYLDANPAIGAYPLAPGRSTTSSEFTLAEGGHVRAMSGHAHDYAVELRLEDAVTNEVLVRLTTKRDPDGHILSVTSDRFVFTRSGLHLDANRRYRVVTLYDNPTCATIPRGGMAFMAGPFAPDDAARLPAVDRTDPRYVDDYAELLGPATEAAHPTGMAGMDDMPGMGSGAGHGQHPVASSCAGPAK